MNDLNNPRNRGGRSGAASIARRMFASVGLVVALFAGLTALSAQNVLDSTWSDVANEVRPSIVSSMTDANVTGLSVVLVDGDRVVWSEGFGYSDLAASKSADADTMFEIGSVSKTFTGLMVMQLVEQGKLDIDRPVTDYIPDFSMGPPARDFPRSDRPITVRDLMTHHSGIPGDLLNGAFATAQDLDYNGRLLSWLAADSATYPPGYRFSYSNTAVSLLENVIEAVTGKDFRAYSQTFLDSLGMSPASYYKTDAALLARLSKSYDEGKELPMCYINVPASGSIVASANEMGRYLKVLIGKGSIDGTRILRPETLSAMLTKQYPGNPLDIGIDQGLSFILSDASLAWAGPLFWHNGATLAFHSHLEILPDQNLGVFVVANSTSATAAVETIAKTALVSALKLKRGMTAPVVAQPEGLTRVALPEGLLKTLAGIYVSDDRGSYDVVEAADGGLAWRTGPADASGSTKDQGSLSLWSDGMFRTAADAPLAYEFKEAGGRFLFVVHKGSAQGIFGERYTPKVTPGAWKAREGSWVATDADPNDIAVVMGELPEVRLSESDGMLIMTSSEMRFVLEPLSDSLAAVRGLGRFGGTAARIVVGADGRETLRFMLTSYEKKGADKASFHALPPEAPGLIPVATFDAGRAYRSSIGGYPVLSLKGSWREMGRQYGALLSEELKGFYSAISADLKARGLSSEHLDMVRSTFQSYTPEMKDLLLGMAETSGMSFEDHMLLDASFYLLPGFVISAAQSAHACSGIAVSSPRTADGTLYFARNWDMTPTAMRPYLRYIALVAFNPEDGGKAFANIRPIGQAYLETGMNSAGVFVELNNGSASDPGSNPNARFAVASLFDFLRTSDSLDEMIRDLTTTKMDASYIVQAADASRAVSVEIPTFDARVIEEKNGALYALNNFARPTYAPWKGKIVELPDNAYDDRQKVLDAMFASPEWQKRVDLTAVKAMMDRRLEAGGPVVAEPTFGTVLQVIAVPKDLRVLFRGYGYSGWADVDLKALFD